MHWPSHGREIIRNHLVSHADIQKKSCWYQGGGKEANSKSARFYIKVFLWGVKIKYQTVDPFCSLHHPWHPGWYEQWSLLYSYRSLVVSWNFWWTSLTARSLLATLARPPNGIASLATVATWFYAHQIKTRRINSEKYIWQKREIGKQSNL